MSVSFILFYMDIAYISIIFNLSAQPVITQILPILHISVTQSTKTDDSLRYAEVNTLEPEYRDRGIEGIGNRRPRALT